MRHPADSKAWKHVDNKYGWFAKEARSIRLGLVSDGFNPFGMQNVTYTTWPVILIPYNLPPWLFEKQPSWIMSMLIPSPKSPRMNIDVYLKPLIDELKDLWEKGIDTWDDKVNKNFKLHAILLWTINDFPTYVMLSGWSTKGKYACPYCHKDTDYLWLRFGKKHCYMGHRRFLPSDHPWRMYKMRFNNEVETREALVPLSGQQLLDQYETFDQVIFGKATSKKRKHDKDKRWHNWRKKSIFELPYWSSLLIRHNLDMMHIEKNICESILGTLLEIEVVRKILPKEVVMPLIQLSRFFSALCSKELVEEDLDKLSSSIKDTLCRLEMVFPPAFFDIMIHLSVHLAEEAKLGGHVCYRWMYLVERYLRTVKGYVRNKALLEGSIAKGYIAEECLTFGSRFLDVDTKLNRADRHESTIVNEPPSGLSVFGEIDYKRRGQTTEIFGADEVQKMRHYIISNCDEARPWRDMEELKNSIRNLNKQHEEHFVRWFEGKITKLYEKGEASELMYALSQGPDYRARVFNRCYINNWLFRTTTIERNLITQNSGVLVRGDGTTGNMTCTSRSRGYSRDKYGVIDIDTSSVVVVRPRNLFAMPEAENEGDMEVDLLDVGIQDMNLLGPNEDLSNWTRPDKDGITGDASVINQVRGEAVLELDDAVLLDEDDDDEDDTYIDDGVVAPVAVESIEDDFFV
ncbi:uncharacterized protein [Miscanthus floridulus]|uniref:uncharacterized protein n=1 Tax=Miscanthus floridulus TaxID=154761 RepID=UPI00345ADC3B